MRPSATGEDSGRKRRISVGVVLFWAAAAGIALGVVSAVGVYARTGYFVDADRDGTVSIYRGRPGGVLWFEPTLSQATEIDLDELPPTVVADVIDNRSFTSSARAMQYLQTAAAAFESTATTTTTTSTTPGSSGS